MSTHGATRHGRRAGCDTGVAPRQAAPHAGRLAATALLAVLLVALASLWCAGLAPARTAPLMDTTAIAGRTSTATPSPGLTVALYEIMPRPGQFSRALAAAWEKLHPDVPLTFITWNAYATDPAPSVDVFEYDAMFLDRFVERGLIAPLTRADIDSPDDVLPLGFEASSEDGTLYAVPQSACAGLLIYRRGDTALEDAEGVTDVVQALGTRTYKGVKPPKGTGLLMDFSGMVTISCHYIEALQDNYGAYSEDPPLAGTSRLLDTWALRNVGDLFLAASPKEAAFMDPNDWYQRARWFGQGYGRAIESYAEGMSQMDAGTQSQLEFRLMPYSDRANVPLFFTNIVSLSPAVASGPKRALAVELANLIAATETMVAGTGADGDASPQ
jgi:thiamine pyridinylase